MIHWNCIGIAFLCMLGTIVALALVLIGIYVLSALYASIRSKICGILQGESLIFIYRRHRKEIDEYLRKKYPEDCKWEERRSKENDKK